MDKQLHVDGKVIEFDYEIRKVKELDNLLIVLLSIPFNEKTTENVYGIDKTGNVVWQVQDPRDIYSIKSHMPYENIGIIEGEKVFLTDFYGRGYVINSSDGTIFQKFLSK